MKPYLASFLGIFLPSVATARPTDAHLGASNEMTLALAMLQSNMLLDFFVQRTYWMCL
jgi:hypothetical protein